MQFLECRKSEIGEREGSHARYCKGELQSRRAADRRLSPNTERKARLKCHRPTIIIGRKTILTVLTSMPNWIPILIVLLTQGSGTMATVHPHDMVRMFKYAAQLETVVSESQAAVESLSSAPIRKSLIRSNAQSEADSIGFGSTNVWPDSDRARDGPSA
jgi:hypothetical protein